jgi:hypothetical protein
MCIIYVYGIFFNVSASKKRYCYIGSSKHPYARFEEHRVKLVSNTHAKFMQCIYNSHGISKTVVFKQTTNEQGRLVLEQLYFDYFAKHDYILVNAIVPKQCTNNYAFAGLKHHRQLLANGAKGRWKKLNEHEKVSARTVEGMQSKHVRDKISAGCKLAHATSDKYKAMYANKQRNANVSAGLRQVATFRHVYGSSTVYRYHDAIGNFKNWMHFIIVNDQAIVYTWDTRIVLFTCKVNALPLGYIHVRHDNYKPLIFAK